LGAKRAKERKRTQKKVKDNNSAAKKLRQIGLKRRQ
jgi:hypothetical protein